MADQNDKGDTRGLRAGLIVGALMFGWPALIFFLIDTLGIKNLYGAP